MKSKDWQLVLNLVDLGLWVAMKVPGALELYEEAKGKIDAMVAEGKNPTAEEHDELNGRINGLRERLHAQGHTVPA